MFCAVALVGLLTACGGNDSPGADRAGAEESTAPATSSQSTPPSNPPTTTAPASTVDGPCPYFDTQKLMDTIGQHLSRSTVTSTKPHPSCTFYRPDDAVATKITVTEQVSPNAAQTAALQTAGGNLANPVDGIGDYGAVRVVDDGTLLAVTKGTSLVVVKINQKSSLQAKEVARLVVPAL